MEELTRIGKKDGLERLAYLESLHNGSLESYINKVAPSYIDSDGKVMKFNLLKDLGWI